MRLDYRGTEKEKAAKSVSSDSVINQIKAMTAEQAASYIQTNVTDLASAKVVLAKMAMMMVYLLKREF